MPLKTTDGLLLSFPSDQPADSIHLFQSKIRIERQGEHPAGGDGVSVTLSGFRSSKGNGFFEPTGDNIFVFPSFEIVNGSNDPIDINDMYDISATCDGYNIGYSFDADCLEKNDLSGQIYPSKKLKGEVGLEVPNDWKELEVKISFGWFDNLNFVIYNQ